jgi:hypothetical protein
MARFIFIIIAFIIAFQTQAFAQQQQQEDETPKTKLEAISLQNGVVLVKEYRETGLKVGDAVLIKALTIYEPGKELLAEKGLSIRILVSTGPLHYRTAFVDIDEIQSLSEALGYMVETVKSWEGTQREYTEVVYITKGDLAIGFFQDGKSVSVFLTVGRAFPETTYISYKDLTQIKTAVDKGLEILGS